MRRKSGNIFKYSINIYKPVISCLLLGVLLFNTACSLSLSSEYNYSKIPDDYVSDNGEYLIAFVENPTLPLNGAANSACWNGIKYYAYENSVSYRYYYVDNSEHASYADRYEAFERACNNGAELVFTIGDEQNKALKQAAQNYKYVHFVNLNSSDTDNYTNLLSVSYHTEQAGFMAGYIAVMEGYTELAFSGGGNGNDNEVCLYGYGFIQGVSKAAVEKKINANVRYSWKYGENYTSSEELKNFLEELLNDKTQILMTAGGNMCNSAFSAALNTKSKVIGSGTDMNGLSETVVFSAVNCYEQEAINVCKDFYGGKKLILYGATVVGLKESAVAITTDNWRLSNFSLKQYEELTGNIINGNYTVSTIYDTLKTQAETSAFANINVYIIN